MSERAGTCRNRGVMMQSKIFCSNFNHGFNGGSEFFRGKLTKRFKVFMTLNFHFPAGFLFNAFTANFEHHYGDQYYSIRLLVKTLLGRNK